MNEYQNSIRLPVFLMLKDFCTHLRDDVVVPMRDSLIEVRKQAELARERLESQCSESRPLKEAPRAAVEGLDEAKPGRGPAASDGRPPRAS